MKKKMIVTIIVLIAILGIGAYLAIDSLEKQGREYEIEQISYYKYFVLKQNEKFGVIDKDGNKIIEAKYDDVKIPNPSKAVFVCYEGENTKVFNENAEEVYKEYSYIRPLRLKNVSGDLQYEKSILQYMKDGKYGILGIDGKKITDAIYEEMDTLKYKEGELFIRLDGKYGVINQKGKVLVKPEYDTIVADGYYSSKDGYKKDGYIVSKKTEDGYRYGYVSVDGELMLNTEYNELSRIADAGDDTHVYLLCAQNGKYGVFENEKQIITNEYQSINYQIETQNFIVQKVKKYGIISLTGHTLLDVKYAQIDVNGDYFYVKDENANVEVYDKEAKKVQMDANLVVLNTEKEDLKIHILTQDDKTVYQVYKNNELTTTEEYNYLEYLYDEYFIAAKKDGTLQIIDSNGNIKTNQQYDSIQKIQDAKLVQATVSKTNVTEIYDGNMNKVAEMKDAVIEKQDSYIEISNQDGFLYFDLGGKEKKVSEVFPDNELFAKKQNGKWGFVDKQENIKVDFIYDQVTQFNSYGFAGIQKDGKWGVINAQGKIILEPTYDLKDQVLPQFVGCFYQVQYGYGEIYYTDEI